MKSAYWILGAAILLKANIAPAATTLNAGESLFYEFTTLSYLEFGGSGNWAKAVIMFVGTTFDGAGDTVRATMYEDSASETPLASDQAHRHWEHPFDGTNNKSMACRVERVFPKQPARRS